MKRATALLRLLTVEPTDTWRVDAAFNETEKQS